MNAQRQDILVDNRVMASILSLSCVLSGDMLHVTIDGGVPAPPAGLYLVFGLGHSRISLKQWIILFHWWAREYPVTDAAEEAEVDRKTAIRAYQHCRDICGWRLQNHDSPLMLGGPGVTVQIDESLFRHKPKVWHWKNNYVVEL